MTALAVTNTLSNAATILASEHNTNYSDIVNYINNRNSGSATWDACSISSSSNVPLVVNNSTGTQDIARFQDNGTNVLQIVDGGIINMASQSSARAYRNTSTQSLSGATKIQFNAETYDIKSEFDPSTNYRFTATATGVYVVLATINITSPASNPAVSIYKNGSAFASSTGNSAASGFSYSVFGILQLSATDYVEIYVNSGASGTVVNGEALTYVAIHKLA